MTPLLSVIVPTKDRTAYCLNAVEALVENLTSDLEIIVSDNGVDDQLERELVRRGLEAQIVYRHWPVAMDICEHFDRALRLSSGRYVAFIGDDDGITCELIEQVRRLDRDGGMALVSSADAGYWWPDVNPRALDKGHGGLLMARPWSRRSQERDSIAELRRVLALGGTTLGYLPRSYQGVVRRDLLDVVRRNGGRVFWGPSPDMSGAVGVALLGVRVRVVDVPLFIAGAAAPSGGGRGASRRHEGRLENEAHLSREVVTGWSEIVPRFFSGPTIWAEGAIRTLRGMGHEEHLSCFNTSHLIASCLLFVASMRARAWEHYSNDLRTRDLATRVRSLSALCTALAKLSSERVQALWSRVGPQLHLSARIRVAGVQDVLLATRIINSRLV